MCLRYVGYFSSPAAQLRRAKQCPELPKFENHICAKRFRFRIFAHLTLCLIQRWMREAVVVNS